MSTGEFVIFVIFNLIVYVDASPGDRHYFYRSCLNHCEQMNCSTSIGLQEFHQQQGFFEYLFQWSCPDECAYQCMWKTVAQMQAEGQPVVQFHGKTIVKFSPLVFSLCLVGKWPFRRFLGIQEPASTVFSIFNFLSNYIFGYKVLRRHLRTPIYPLSSMWLIFCLISMNAWIWSTVFHTRDKSWTEIFDYIAAISLVFSQFACCLIRVGYRTSYRYLSYLSVGLLAIFFLYHAHYLLICENGFWL